MSIKHLWDWASLEEHEVSILAELRRNGADSQPAQILGAWKYALDTMIEETRGKKTCSWIIEGTEENDGNDLGGGEIMLRRV